MGEDRNWLNYWVDPKSWSFRGDFEGIFRDFEDPWHCKDRVESLERRVLTAVATYRKHDTILDVGCGLGVYTELLRQASGAKRAVGIDVSPTAVERASKNSPDCEFHVVDLMEDQLPFANKEFSLIVVTEVLWYVLPNLEEILRGLGRILKDEGSLVLEQSFPDEQKFGTEYLNSPEELRSRYLEPAGFQVDGRFDCPLEGEKVAIFTTSKRPAN